MVKTKKNKSNIKVKFNTKKQKGGSTAVSFGQYRHSGDTLSAALKAESTLQETMSQTQTGKTKLIQLYAEDARWGTVRGSNTYIQILGYLKGIRDKNIRSIEEILSTINKKGANYQLKAIKIIKTVHTSTVKERFQRIVQLKRDTEMAFKNSSLKKLKQRKNQSVHNFELEQRLSDKVHTLRSKILNDIITFVRNENSELSNLLEGVLSNDKTKSFKDSI